MSAPRTPNPSPLAGEGGELCGEGYAAGVTLAASGPGEGASSHRGRTATP